MPDLDCDTSDADLVQRCRDGDERSWRALVRRYERLVYTVPRRAGLSPEQAADVFQSTFSRLFEHLDGVLDGARVRAWLVTTARRETLRLLERLPPASRADPDDAAVERLVDGSPLPDDVLDALQQQHRVRRAVAQLDDRSRRFVELVFLRDEPPSYEEIAAELGMPIGSIGPTRARCLAKLRELLAKE
ncbi:RNA polymerase sigma factor [Ideonella sp. A 288]|uniref:RNA polymerase sigma factor n=1 Tax=Ideonella sp. A 288 TaxID=1962181 RepID=UPI001302EB48|nr:sigma-70 family RNA polymerase sigma factor [Ideonella sp. A 288]